MQFVEKNSLNVRSAVYHLKKDGCGLEFVLFPMVHVGSKEFYEEVGRRLDACDLILAEGVNSKRAGLLTFSYRVVRRVRRMELVTQQEGLSLSRLRGKIVNADMRGRDFDERWAALPFGLRAQLLFLVPAYALYLFLFGTKETLAANIAVEDLASSDEVLFDDDEDFGRLDALLLDDRDRKLLERIGALHDSERGRKTVGVVYGATHMRAVAGFLMDKLKYRVERADWVTVFDL